MQDLLTYLSTLWDSYQGIFFVFLKGVSIFIFGLYIAYFARSRTKVILQNKDRTLAGFIAQIVFASLLILSCITALGTLGIQTNSIVALLGTAGIAVALGLQNSLSNLASGVIIIILRPFKTGDFIEFGSISGVVESVSLFHTTLLLDNQTQAILPNETIAKGNIINHSTAQTKSITWQVSIQSPKQINEIQDILQNALPPSNRDSIIQLISIKDDLYVFKIIFSLRDAKSNQDLFSLFVHQVRTSFSTFEASIKD